MDDLRESLLWKDLSSRDLLSTRVFRVREKQSESPKGTTGSYDVIDAPDWAMVIPVIGDDFLMVRQWRHGSACLSLEFPGGTTDPGEAPEVTAARELEEETGYRAESLTLLGEYNPNPALFTNHMRVYLAEGLTPTGTENLDPDEVLRHLRIPIREVIERYGTGELIHAYVGTALGLYLRRKYLSDAKDPE